MTERIEWPWTARFNGEIVGKGRPQFDRRTGNARTPDKTRAAEADLKYGMRQLWPWAPIDGPVAVRALIFVAPPASWSAKRRAAAIGTAASCKPDIDNAFKLIADAGNGVIWADDSQIASIEVRRTYAEAAGLRLFVEPIVTPDLRASSTMSCETIVDTLDCR